MLPKQEHKPDRKFSMDKDGFWGEYHKPAVDKFPGKAIVAFGGSAGKFLLTQLFADFCVRDGINVVIVAYHDAPGLSKVMKDQPVETVENAGRWLKSQGFEKIGLWGISMGGELALIAGSMFPDLFSCVVAVAPIQMVMQAEDNKKPIEGSSFAYKGTPLPYARYVPDNSSWKKQMLKDTIKHKEPYTRDLLIRAYEQNMNEEAEIKIENMKASLLLLGSKADSMTPDEYTIKVLTERLKKNNYKYPVKYRLFDHISHLITPMKPISAKTFVSERKHPEECGKERKLAWAETLSFFANNW